MIYGFSIVGYTQYNLYVLLRREMRNNYDVWKLRKCEKTYGLTGANDIANVSAKHGYIQIFCCMFKDDKTSDAWPKINGYTCILNIF